jgi:hypothetical protein
MALIVMSIIPPTMMIVMRGEVAVDVKGHEGKLDREPQDASNRA